MSQNDKYLKVINASAGSGKTYSLVKEYIHLLLQDDDPSSNFKYAEILAMTFTNKAALEMKTRIVKALDELAHPDFYDGKYLDTIAESTGLQKEIVCKKASRMLSGILHRYEDFHVMTIDKFNLRLIRSFSRDLDLPPDFEVVLDEDALIEEVVDDLLSQIGRDATLTQVFLDYAHTNLEDEEAWNIRTSLIEFGKVLKKERDLPFVKQLMEMDFSKQHFQELKKNQRQLSQEYERLLNELGKFSFAAEDFSRGKDIINRIAKQSDYPLKGGFVFTDTMVKNISDAKERSVSHQHFFEVVQRIWNFYETQHKNYLLIGIILKNFFNMALLKQLNLALTALSKNERVIRISEFNTMISSLLQDDALFVYERLGTRFRHFMLDEFQDTSRLQWKNLLPLIRESLSNGNDNLIVGDPKQAIYRFKDGVAEQFVALPGVYNPEKDPKIEEISNYFKGAGVILDLEDNWRSSYDIIDFNNHLFLSIKDSLKDEQRDFYKSVKQNPRSKNRGYVYVESSKKSKDNATILFNEYLAFIEKSIQDAINDGFQPGDICVLTRKNKFGNFIANALSSNGYSVVSADSLNIDLELTVQFMLSYLKVRLNPVNTNVIRQFAHLYCELFDKNLAYYNQYFVIKDESGRTSKFVTLDAFLQGNSSYQEAFLSPYEGLYDLVQKAIRLFGLEELKNPYLHHFADLVHQFEIKNGPDLNQFLKGYEELSKESKALQIPESSQAIKVMTIHKSKGLEFPVVIVTNQLDDSVKGSYFVQTDNELVYTGLSGSSPIDEIKASYEIEHQNNYLDDLNLMYVAYTRPVHRLYIKNVLDKHAFNTQFHSIISTMEGVKDEEDGIILEKGEKNKNSIRVEEESSDVFYSPVTSNDNLWFPDIALQDSEELTDATFLSDEQRYGNQFHLCISRMNHIDELEQTIYQLTQEGQIEEQFVDSIREQLKALYQSNEFASLYKDAQEIYSEQSFIISRNEQIRPDKIIVKKDATIVIDFKTGQPLKKHNKQVLEYQSILREMGFENVTAYLLYTKDVELIKVEG